MHVSSNEHPVEITGERESWLSVLTGEIDRSSTGGVNPVRGCLNNPSRLD
jgi:hypothetical protein